MIIGINGKIGSGKDTVGNIIQYLTTYYAAQYTHPITAKDFDQFLRYDHHLTSSFQIKKFAGKLKEMVSLFTGIPVVDMEKSEVKDGFLGEEWMKYSWAWVNSNIWHPCTKQEYDTKKTVGAYKVEKAGMTLRWFLQHFGTEAVRNNIHPNAWVNALFADYKYTEKFYDEQGNQLRMKGLPNWIITDMRFPNEYQAVKERNGICVRVNRPRYLRDPEGFVAEALGTGLGGMAPQPLSKSMYDKAIADIHPSEIALDNHVFDYEINNSGTIDELIIKVQKFINHFNLKSK